MNKTKINILIADDDQDDAFMLVEGLTEVLSSFEVATTSDGVECLEFLKSDQKPDLVFLDVNMPLKNGIECLRDIKNEQLLQNTPVIIYSTSNNRHDIDASFEYGANCYIVKPPSYSGLIKLLNMAFQQINVSAPEQGNRKNFVLREDQFAS